MEEEHTTDLPLVDEEKKPETQTVEEVNPQKTATENSLSRMQKVGDVYIIDLPDDMLEPVYVKVGKEGQIIPVYSTEQSFNVLRALREGKSPTQALKHVNDEEINKILAEFEKAGVPKDVIEEMRKNPEKLAKAAQNPDKVKEEIKQEIKQNEAAAESSGFDASASSNLNSAGSALSGQEAAALVTAAAIVAAPAIVTANQATAQGEKKESTRDLINRLRGLPKVEKGKRKDELKYITREFKKKAKNVITKNVDKLFKKGRGSRVL